MYIIFYIFFLVNSFASSNIRKYFKTNKKCNILLIFKRPKWKKKLICTSCIDYFQNNKYLKKIVTYIYVYIFSQ